MTLSKCTKTLLLGVLLLSSINSAGAADESALELQDIFNRAHREYSQKQPADSLATLDQAYQLIWTKIPFTVRQVHLLQGPPTQPGQYQPRADDILKPDEPLVIYLEPIGFKVRTFENMFSYHLLTDYKLIDAWGRVIHQQKGFSSLEGRQFSFPAHLSMVIGYNFTGLSPGDYQVETTVHDRLGRKSVLFHSTFRIQP